MKVSEIMTSPVVVTQKNKSINHVKELLDRKNINAIPVLSMEGEIEGIVSVSDLVAEQNGNRLVDEIMNHKTYVISTDSGVKDAAKMMEKHRIHHLVVMDDGQVRGIVSSMDMVRLVAES